MSWTFNPPPGWPPQPAGWRPPPGWAPDPAWPPAPTGWQFWLPAPAPPAPVAAAMPDPARPDPAVTGPVQLLAGGRSWHQQWWAVGAAALVTLLAGCLVGAVLALLTGG